MRQETQHWDQVRATLEIVVAGTGQTGLSPTVAILRLSDNLWLQAGGGSWGASIATNTLTEVSSSNLPGLYSYSIPSARLTYEDGYAGYLLKFSESTQFILEYATVHVERSEWDEAVSDHVSLGSAGLMLQAVHGLVQGNHRLKNPTYDSEGRMLTAELAVYPTSSDALADTSALVTYNVTCTYNAFGDLTSLLSRT